MNWIEVTTSLMETASRLFPPGLAFIESMTQYLAWPITVIILAVLLRGRLLEVIGRLAGVEGFGFKLWFTQEASALRGETEEQVRDQAAERVEETEERVQEPPEPVEEPEGAASPRPATADRTQPVGSEESARITPARYVDFIRKHVHRQKQALDLSANLSRSGAYAPRTTVLESFKLLEFSLQDLETLVRHSPNARQSVPVILRDLVLRNVISGENANSILALNKLRAAVVHTEEPVSVEAAKDYATSVSNMLSVLNDSYPRARHHRS